MGVKVELKNPTQGHRMGMELTGRGNCIRREWIGMGGMGRQEQRREKELDVDGTSGGRGVSGKA